MKSLTETPSTIYGIVVAALFVSIGFVGCGPSDDDAKEALVVYCGRSEGLVKPLFDRFEKDTGIQVDVAYGKSTPALANRLALEARSGGASPCDLFLAQDGGHLGALAKAGLLRPLPTDLLMRADERFRDPLGRWVGTSGRLRVMVFDPQRTPVERLPKTLEELPHCGLRVGWAPGNGSFRAHISAMLTAWGEEKTKAWLIAMKKTKPLRFAKNSPQVKAVAAGEIDVGWVNHYYVHKLMKQNPQLKAQNMDFAQGGKVDNVMMLAGFGISAESGSRRKNAELLAEFLLSDFAQNHFAQEIGEYPTVAGIALADGVTPMSEITLAQVETQDLIDVGRVASLLESLDIR